MTNSIQAVLFDLDGTLADTANDLVFALNRLRFEQGLSNEVPMSVIRPVISYGSRYMVKTVMGIDDAHPNLSTLREQFLNIYQTHLADKTTLFPNMDKVLTYLDQCKIPWGIVTNKLTRHTTEIVKALQLEQRALCVVCGDSLSTQKPNPQTILHGCKLLNVDPANCLYVGDAANDVVASKAAGARSLVALYGYICAQDDPYTWNADGYIHDPAEMIEIISSSRELVAETS